MSLPQKNAGFTLVELLVVVAILGILAGLVTLNVINTLPNGRDARRISDVNMIEQSLEEYFSQNKEYPQASADGNFFEYSTNANFLSTLLTGDYLKSKPQDPLNSSSNYYKYENKNNSGTVDKQTFAVRALMEKKTSGENIYRYCNGASSWGSYYYFKFSSYTYRKSYTNEASCTTCTTTACYKPQW